MKTNIKHLKEMLSQESNIMVLTGAGVSTLSGIPDFASLDNVWKHDVPREIAMSALFFKTQPEKFWKIYKEIFEIKFLSEKIASSTHNFITSLEEHSTVRVYTQNVDGLHQKAGSTDVLNLHGDASTVKCLKCKFIFPTIDYMDKAIPMCDCGGKLKPTVILFGEYSPLYGNLSMDMGAYGAVLIMGTSLNVAPVNRVPQVLRAYPRVNTIYWDNSAVESNIFKYYMNDDFNELNNI